MAAAQKQSGSGKKSKDAKHENPKPLLQRVLLKLSGEALMGSDSFGINPAVVGSIAQDIAQTVQMGVQMGIVIGGGNLFRGVAGASAGMDRATADHMGMLATLMNAMALSDALKSQGIDARVQSALRIDQVVEPYIRGKALSHLGRGRVVIFAAGTGNPFFTTDTAAALRAAEMNAQIVLKATKIDGIYDKDPHKHKDAKHLAHVTFDQALGERLAVMDATAFALCREQHLPIRVFNIHQKGALVRIAQGATIGTLVDDVH